MLDVGTLQTVRQVSPLWNSVSTHLMFFKGYFRVPRGFYDERTKVQNSKKIMIKKFLSSSSIKIDKLRLKHKYDEEILFEVLGTHNKDVTQLKIRSDWKGGKTLVKKSQI